MKRLRILCVLCGVALGAIAVLHAVKAARGDGDVPRHLLFVAIDGVLGALVASKPRWALVPVCVLFVQQLGTHGRDLLASVRSGPLDVESLVVLVFFGALIGLLATVASSRAGRGSSA